MLQPKIRVRVGVGVGVRARVRVRLDTNLAEENCKTVFFTLRKKKAKLNNLPQILQHKWTSDPVVQVFVWITSKLGSNLALDL